MRESYGRLLIWVSLLLVSAAAVWAAGDDQRESIVDPMEEPGYRNTLLFARVMETIRENYVDPDMVDPKELTYGALKGMLSSLDPHSQFMRPEDFDAMRDDAEGRFGGIGVTIAIENRVPVVVTPMEGTPGFEAGLQPRDRIVRIEQKSTEGMNIGEVVRMLKGPVGTTVKITIFRPETGELIDHELKRATITVDSVRDVRLLPAEMTGPVRMGYIRIVQFNEPTASEFERALKKLEKQGMEALVIDLRYNPGGLLGSAVEVAGKFIAEGEVVVSTEGRTNSPTLALRPPAMQANMILRSDDGPKHSGYPVAVLINSASASGAEIVAGALKDLGRALLVGETTFGKGSVQTVMELEDGAAVRLTTSKYYTPSHRTIHERGVEPDILAPVTVDEMLKLRHQSLFGPRDKEEGAVVDSQLQRAVNALRGVYVFSKLTGTE